MTRERPILFSGPMVRAIIEGKTQTRRIVKRPVIESQQHAGGAYIEMPSSGINHVAIARSEWLWKACPYGQPGDRLWVRETFYCDHAFYPTGRPACRTPDPSDEELRKEMLEVMCYRADGEPQWEGGEGPTPWRPSIHMPRWASRITLEITDVRVQRLLEISEADCYAEGVRTVPSDQRAAFVPGTDFVATGGTAANRYVGCYSLLWDSVNLNRAPWNSNPWVWAITFKRVAP